MAVGLYIPIAFLIWIVPYVDALRPFMKSLKIWRGNTLYVFTCLTFSSIMQFFMGRSFYVSAYKSLKHKSANMDVLIMLGTTSAWIYGVILMIMGYSKKDQESA